MFVRFGWAGVELKDQGPRERRGGRSSPQGAALPWPAPLFLPFCPGLLWPDLRPHSLSALMVLTPRSSDSFDIGPGYQDPFFGFFLALLLGMWHLSTLTRN